MPYNLIKEYNEKLELDGLCESKRIKSLSNIFQRDFLTEKVYFRKSLVRPTPKEGKSTIEVLFDHLTKRKNDEGGREYDRDRSVRLHWVKHHITECSPSKICVFSSLDKEGIRTYIHDKLESYVVILEPRIKLEVKYYYLLTAYYYRGKDAYKFEKKEKRKLSEVY